jgi:hypothetical protein
MIDTPYLVASSLRTATPWKNHPEPHTKHDRTFESTNVAQKKQTSMPLPKTRLEEYAGCTEKVRRPGPGRLGYAGWEEEASPAR